MKKDFLLWFFILLLVIGLGMILVPALLVVQMSAPTSALRTPTAVALNTPVRTLVPASPATALDVKNVSQSKVANEIVKTASVTTAQNLGVGQIDLSYPETMTVGESRTVRLRLQPATQLVTSGKEPPKKNLPNAPNFVYKFSGNIDLYPVMNAQLIALGFNVNPSGRVQQVVDTAAPAN